MVEYSQPLCSYIGQIEFRASQATDSFARYMCFYDALDSLASIGLTEEDSRLAREILRTRARETRPWNIGGASGELGEAD